MKAPLPARGALARIFKRGSGVGAEMMTLCRFGGPLALSELILVSIFLTDILMLGLIGELDLSAALLVNATFVLVYVTAHGFLQGALPLAARHYERAQDDAWRGVVSLSILQSSIIALISVSVALMFPVALTWLDYPGDLVAKCRTYILWILPAYGFAMIYIALRNAVISTGSSRWFMTLSVMALALNAMFNLVLGFGFEFGGLSFEGMGIAGIGLATSLVDVVYISSFGFLAWRAGFRFDWLWPAEVARRWRASLGPHLRQSIVIGLPVAVIFFVDSTLFSGVLIIVGRSDIEAMAAMALIFEWAALAVMIPFGLSEAVVQRVARVSGGAGTSNAAGAAAAGGASGAGDTSHLVNTADSAGTAMPDPGVTARAAVYLALVYAGLLVAVYLGLGVNVPALFLLDAQPGSGLLARLDDFAIAGLVAAVLYGFVVVLASVLRGLLDVNMSMIATMVCYWIFGLGLALLFVEIAGLDAHYALHAVNLALAMSVVWIGLRLFLRLFRRGRDGLPA